MDKSGQAHEEEGGREIRMARRTSNHQVVFYC